MTEHYADEFKGYFSAWMVTPCSVNIAYLARYIDSKWVLWNCRLTFGPLVWPKEEKWEVHATDIRAGNIRLNIQSVEFANSLLQSAIDGILNLDDLRFAFSNNDTRSYYLSTTEHNPVFFSHVLKIKPSQSERVAISHNQLFRIDEKLRCGSLPFDGISDLFSFLGFAEATLLSDAFVELIIQPPADLDTSLSSMNAGDLQLKLIKHPAFDSSLISIGLRCFPNPSIDRRFAISTDKVIWNCLDGFALGELHEKLADTVMVQVFISINGKVARRHVIHDRSRAINLKYLAHQYFDPNLRKLKDALVSEKNSRDFEKAVTVVFNILGFSASAFMDSEAPDIILFSPKGKLLLVECTLQAHDIRTKAGKLHHRRTELQQKIKVDFPWVDVVAILVCNQQRNTITEDRFLTDNKIILYCEEDVQSALDQLQLLSDPDILIESALDVLEKKYKNHFGGNLIDSKG